MAKRDVIVIKKPGELINKAYLEKVNRECSSYMGTGLVHGGKLIVDHKKGKWLVEAVMEVQDKLKDSRIMFVFGENKDILDEDMMPFDVLADKASDTHVLVAMDGNFRGYEHPKSTHTHEWHCKEEFLNQKLPKLFRTANAGLQGLMEELNDPITQQDFSNSWTDRGFITFFTTAGAVSIYNKGNIFKADYNWGSVSNGLSYVEQTVAKEEKKEEKKPSMLDRLLAKKEEAPAPSTANAAAIVAAAANGDYEEVGPAPAELTNKDKISWWVNEIGYKPEGYKNSNTKVKRLKGTKQGLLAPLAATNVSDPKTRDEQFKEAASKGDPVKDKALTNDEVKTLPDKVAPEGAKDVTPKHVSLENMPILSPRQKLQLQKGWMLDGEVLRMIGEDHKAMAFDPKKLKELEDNYQTFYDGLGLDGETMWLSFEAIEKLGHADLKALMIFAFNRQNDFFRANVRLKTILADPSNKIAGRALAM